MPGPVWQLGARFAIACAPAHPCPASKRDRKSGLRPLRSQTNSTPAQNSFRRAGSAQTLRASAGGRGSWRRCGRHRGWRGTRLGQPSRDVCQCPMWAKAAVRTDCCHVRSACKSRSAADPDSRYSNYEQYAPNRFPIREQIEKSLKARRFRPPGGPRVARRNPSSDRTGPDTVRLGRAVTFSGARDANPDSSAAPSICPASNPVHRAQRKLRAKSTAAPVPAGRIVPARNDTMAETVWREQVFGTGTSHALAA